MIAPPTLSERAEKGSAIVPIGPSLVAPPNEIAKLDQRYVRNSRVSEKVGHAPDISEVQTVAVSVGPSL